MKIAAILLSYKRPLNMPLVVEGIERQSFIDDLIIFHNHPSNQRFENHINIVSDINFGCVVRHQIAALLKYDYFVFIDDDLYLNKDMSDVVKPAIESHGSDSVLGLFGRNVNAEDADSPYGEGRDVNAKRGDHAVDIIKGRFHILSKRFVHVLMSTKFNTNSLLSEDDIRANVAVQSLTNKPSYIIKRRPEDILNLPEPDSLWRRDNHFELRDKAIRDAIMLGWKSYR